MAHLPNIKNSSRKIFIEAGIESLVNLVNERHDNDSMMRIPLLGVITFFELLITQLDEEDVIKISDHIIRSIKEDENTIRLINEINNDLSNIDKVFSAEIKYDYHK